MNTTKNVPAKFLAEDCVLNRVINFANKHNKVIIPETGQLCAITPTRETITYKGGKIRKSEHFAYKADVKYQVWLYETTDGCFVAHRLTDGKKAIFEPERFKKTDLKKVVNVNRKKLRQRVNGAGVTFLAKV